MALANITISVSSSFGGTTQAPVYIGAAAPSVPVNGTLWMSTETGRLYCYYIDANTSQWVEV